MAANSVSIRDISRLREVLDLTRPDRTASAVGATFRVLKLIRELIGCDAAQFQDHDSSDFSLSYCQFVDDDGAAVLSGEEIADMDDDPGVHLLKERWWTSCCSLIERTGRPVVTTLRSGRSAREWAQDSLHNEYLRVADEVIMGFPISTFHSLRILLPRETGSAFGEREITLLTLLLPHLQPLMTAAFEEGTRAQPAPLQTLTTRQQEILSTTDSADPTAVSSGLLEACTTMASPSQHVPTSVPTTSVAGCHVPPCNCHAMGWTSPDALADTSAPTVTYTPPRLEPPAVPAVGRQLPVGTARLASGQPRGHTRARLLCTQRSTLTAMSKVVPVRKFRSQLSDLLDEVTERREHVTVTRHGRPAAVLIPVAEYEGLEETADILSDDPTLQAIQQGLADLAAEETVSLGQVRAEIAARQPA